MRRKQLRTILALAAVCTCTISALTACGTTSDPRITSSGTSASSTNTAVTLYVGSTIFESSLDPIKGAMSYGYPFINNALLKVAPNGGYIGDLASSWEISSDALHYAFTLRPDVQFSDGSALTATDVAFTFQQVKDHQENNPDVDLSRLSSIDVIDDDTVVFTLSEPYSPFFDTCAMLQIVPSDSYDSEEFDTHPIGSAAYKVLEYQPNQKIVLERNDYWRADGNANSDANSGSARSSGSSEAPQIERVTLVNLSQEAAFGAAQSGQLDAVMVPATYAEENIDGMRVEKLPTIDVRQLNLPVETAQNVVDSAGNTITIGNDITADPAIREALAIGINREQIIENALNGVGKPAVGFVGNLPWAAQRINSTGSQREAAMKLLDAAGWIDRDGDGVREKDGANNTLHASISIYAPSGDEDRYNLALALAQDAKNLGIELKIKTATWSEISTLAYANPVVWGWGQYSPTALPNLLRTSPPDIAGESYANTALYTNQSVDSLIASALASHRQDEANELWRNAQRTAEKDNPYLYLANIEHVYFLSNRLDISLSTQIDHPHGHGSPILCNLADWKLK